MTTTFLSLVLALAPAAEAPANNEDADDAARVSSSGETTVYEYADEELTGDVLSPDGHLIPWRRPATHPSLIDLRGHFLPELVRLSLDL